MWAVHVGKSQAQMKGRFVLFFLLERIWQLLKGGGRKMQKILGWSCSGMGLELPRLIPAQCLRLWVPGTNLARTTRCSPKRQTSCIPPAPPAFLMLVGKEQHPALWWGSICANASLIPPYLLPSLIATLSLAFTNGSRSNLQDGSVGNNHSATPQLPAFALKDLLILHWPLLGRLIFGPWCKGWACSFGRTCWTQHRTMWLSLRGKGTTFMI